MKNLLLIAMLSSMTVACSTVDHKAHKLDTSLKLKAEAGSRVTIGVKDEEMVAQQEMLASEILRDAQNAAYSTESDVYGGERYYNRRGLYGVLEECYSELATYTGDLNPMPESRAYVIPDERYELGMDTQEKNLIGVKREYLKERLEKFKQYKATLDKRQHEYSRNIKLCEIAIHKEKQKRTVASQQDAE